MNIKLIWFGCYSDNTNAMIFEYENKKFRVLIENNFNCEPTFYPQHIDENGDVIDFVDGCNYTYDECIELIKNYATSIKFNELCENISGINVNGERFGCAINDISAWYTENDYNNFIGNGYESSGIEIEYNGIKYIDHWCFVNESHESSVIGYSLRPIDGDGDILFYICGCHVDHVCTFDEMINYLQSDFYFVD